MSIAGEVSRLLERVREAGDARRLARGVRLERPTLVFGSAPRSSLPPGWRVDDPLVTINASQVPAEALGLPPPTLTVLSVDTLGGLESNREAQRVLAGRRTCNLLVVASPLEWNERSSKLKDMGYFAGRLCRVTTRFRSRVVRAATGDDAGRGDAESVKVSNGVYAICQALALGAPEVVVAGFSLTSGGHAYNARGHKRLHVAPDARAFAALATRAPNVYAATDALAVELGLPAWRGR